MEKKRNSPAKNLPSWRVTSEGSFWDVASRERPAILLPFGGEFQWFGSHWVVPGVYSTAKALVVDFCRQVDVDAMRAFQEKTGMTSATTPGRRSPASRRKAPWASSSTWRPRSTARSCP